MSPSSGKASGKTPRPPKDVMTALFFGEAVFSPSAQNALANYIAELEAELRTECVHCGQPIPHVHKHESTRELALRLRAEKAEAEVKFLLAKKATPRTGHYNQATDRWEEVG